MTSWGGYDNHLRVGIDWSISPSSPSHNDTTVQVTWTWYVDSDGWNFDDPQTMHESATGYSNDQSFTDTTTGSAQKVNSHTETYGISYNSGNVTASGNISGAYNGATPSHSVTVNLPNRPVAAPSAGEAPVASSVTTTTAHISWNSVDDNGGAAVDEYQIQIDNSSSFSSPVIDHTFNQSGNASYDASGLTPNTHYYARVRAHNSAGWGDWTSSTYCQFTTLAGTPSTPTTLGYTSKTQNSITLGWAPSSANGSSGLSYTAECYSDIGLTTLVSSVAGITGTSHQFTGLTVGTTYYFRVKATTSTGSSGWSTTYSTATKSATTYVDEGDYVTLVNNLASAVADKLLHLGTFLYRGKTTTDTLANGRTYLRGTTAIETCTQPDPPTDTGSASSASVQINYPGTYQIEFAVCVPGNSSTQALGMEIYHNGHAGPQSTDGTGGGTFAAPWNSNVHTDYQLMTITRRCQAGDTIGFAIDQTTGSSVVTQGATGSPFTMYYRVTMVGF